MSEHRLRPYRDADLEPCIALWLEAWSVAMPEIDFTARLPWWRARWQNEMLVVGEIIVAEGDGGALSGFVALTPATGYLDQIVVAPGQWGQGLAGRLLDYVKGRSPDGVELHVNQGNPRALRFYRRHGFDIAGEAVNPLSGLATYRMRWEGTGEP